MSQRIDARNRTFPAGEALVADRLVKFNGTSVVYADAGDPWHGLTEYPVASGDPIGCLLPTKEGTLKMTAAAAVVSGAAVYTAADGKVSSTAYGRQVGIALEAASGDGARFEVLVTHGNPNVVAFAAGEDLLANRLVKVDTDGDLIYADADHKAIGYTLAAASSAATVYVALFGPIVTLTVAAATPAGADLYTAADGKVDDTATDFFVGIALASTANANDPVRAVLMPSVEVQP